MWPSSIKKSSNESAIESIIKLKTHLFIHDLFFSQVWLKYNLKSHFFSSDFVHKLKFCLWCLTFFCSFLCICCSVDLLKLRTFPDYCYTNGIKMKMLPGKSHSKCATKHSEDETNKVMYQNQKKFSNKHQNLLKQLAPRPFIPNTNFFCTTEEIVENYLRYFIIFVESVS